jgi:hypothetical protein
VGVSFCISFSSFFAIFQVPQCTLLNFQIFQRF